MKKMISIVSFTILLFSYGTQAQSDEYKYHPVFLYSFAKYIEWPPEASTSSFIIGVYGDSPVIPYLKKMAQEKRLDNKNIVIRKIVQPKQVEGCHIIFIPYPKSNELLAIRKRIRNKPVLLVTEMPGLAHKGSSINLVKVNGKQKFEINLGMLNNIGLKASTQLTRLGIVIHS